MTPLPPLPPLSPFDIHILCVGCQFEGSNEVGVFSRLTNAYALVCVGGSESFYSVYEAALADHIPVIHTTVAGCRFVGRVCVGGTPRVLRFFMFSSLRFPCGSRLPCANQVLGYITYVWFIMPLREPSHVVQPFLVSLGT